MDESIPTEAQVEALRCTAAGAGALQTAVNALSEALAKVEGAGHGEAQHAQAMLTEVIPHMEAVRAAADGLEKVVDDDLWPLPKYRELMFIR